MFKLAHRIALIAVFTVSLCAAQTVTPNLGLSTPPIHSLNWGGLVDGNFSSLDQYLSGVKPLPATFWSDALASNSTYGSVELNAGATNTTAENASNKGVINGYAPLDTNGDVPLTNLYPFHGSGTGHMAGTVPDAGATAGGGRFLREDGTWSAPPPTATYPTSTGVAVYNVSTNQWVASLSAPSSGLVGLTDSQTLTNKIVNGVTLNSTGSAGFFLQANGLYAQLSYASLTGSIPVWNQNSTGNSATATAFATTPTGCGTGLYATSIGANGNLGCAAPASSALTGQTAGQLTVANSSTTSTSSVPFSTFMQSSPANGANQIMTIALSGYPTNYFYGGGGYTAFVSAGALGSGFSSTIGAYSAHYFGDPTTFNAYFTVTGQKMGAPSAIGNAPGISSADWSALYVYQNTYNNGTPVSEYHMTDRNMKIMEGGNYTSTGWSVYKFSSDIAMVGARSITQGYVGVLNIQKVGDFALWYYYLSLFGGHIEGTDEALTARTIQAFQSAPVQMTIGSTSVLTATPAANAIQMVGASYPSCATGGYIGSGFVCNNAQNQGGVIFADGQLVYDSGASGATPTTYTPTGVSYTAQGLTATFATAPISTASTAWGVLSGCSSSIFDSYGSYFSTTCTLSVTSGTFVNNQMVGLAGSVAHEFATVTAVSSTSMTFLSRHDWNYGSIYVMQGGPLGKMMVTNITGWPIAYPVIGATSTTTIQFANWHNGNADGAGSQVLPTGPVGFFCGAEVTKNSTSTNVFNLATNNCSFPAGDVLVGAASSEYQIVGDSIIVGQGTPQDSGTPSQGYWLQDYGNYPIQAAFYASTLIYNAANPNAYVITPQSFMHASGAYQNLLNSDYVPVNGGAVINFTSTAANNPWIPTYSTGSYYLLLDNVGPGIQVIRYPTNTFNILGSLFVQNTFTSALTNFTGAANWVSGASANFNSGSTFIFNAGAQMLLQANSYLTEYGSFTLSGAGQITSGDTNGIPLFGQGMYAVQAFDYSAASVSGIAYEPTSGQTVYGYDGYVNSSFSTTFLQGWTVKTALLGNGIQLCTNVSSGVCAVKIALGSNDVHFGANAYATTYVETLSTPTSSTSTCVQGVFSDDANYHYVCTATNNWKRVALTAF
jgi:hypothetical protein